PTAEEVKITIGSAYAKRKTKKSESESTPDTEQFYVVRGRDMASGLPKSIKFSSIEVREALAPVVRQIIAGITETLEETPPELVADILDAGITLAGGTGQLRGLDQLIAEHTKMPVKPVKEPQLSVVRGCARSLEDPKLLQMVKVVGGLH